MAWFSSHCKLQSSTVPGNDLLFFLSFAETLTDFWPTVWPTRCKSGLKAALQRRSERELFLKENSSKAPEHNGSYTPERLVRMRSPVRIWPAAPKKPDSFENQAFLRLNCSEILLSFFPDPHADPREGKNAEISPGERFKLPHSLGAFHCILRRKWWWVVLLRASGPYIYEDGYRLPLKAKVSRWKYAIFSLKN